MPRDELIGSVIDGRFEILDTLGRGGMGTVYRAFQRSVKREVAIKVIRTALSNDPMIAKRFEREARLASKLSQPNTVSVFDYGRTEDGRLFIAMELLKGQNLADLVIEHGPVSIDRAVRIGSQICDALEAAHAVGIVHRDLKLENVIVLDDPPGRDLLKVLDFGLAKSFGEVSISSGSGIVGTPRYMAPEVATKGTSSTASDVYALGVMLAEIVIGEPLWKGDNLSELIAHKLDPAPTVARVPMQLRRPIGALIDPDPDKRPTAAQTRTLLRTIADGSIAFPPPRAEPARPPTPQPAPRRPLVRWPFLVLLVLAVAGAVVAADAFGLRTWLWAV